MVRHTGEDFVDVEGIAIASVLLFQSPGVHCTELDAPEADCFAAYCDATLCEQIFNIAVAVTTRLRLNLY
nr:hypothetical protein [Candidatus Litorirhabdus singularis]